LQDKLTINLAKEDYLPSFEKTLKQYAKNVNIPGFRKGMVPAGMIRKMYGQSVFTDEVLRTAERELGNYINNEKIAIFAQPMIIADANTPVHLDMNLPSDVTFSFEIGLKPMFEIPAIQHKQTLQRYRVQVSDKMLEDEIERIRRRFGKTEEQETITAPNDMLYATYEACDEKGEAAADVSKIEDTELVEKLPALLQERLLGQKKGNTLVFRPIDVCSEEELAVFLKDTIKDAAAAAHYFKLTITNIKHLTLHELNEALFDEVYPNCTDEQQFRAKLQEELSKEYDRVAAERLQNEIYEMLVHNTPIDLPEPFLKRWLKEGQEKPKTEAAVAKEFPSFRHQLLWSLISDKLIADNKIEVSSEEINDYIKQRVLAYFGMKNTEEDTPTWMDGYLAKAAKDEKTMNETYRQLLYSKLFTFLETQFNIEEKEIQEDAFFKLPNPHDAHHHHH
jgi:trigger factor